MSFDENKHESTFLWTQSPVRVEVNHAHFQPLMRRVNFYRHDGYVHLVRDGFRRGQGEFEALVRRVPARPALGEAQGLAQVGQIGFGVFGRTGDRAKEQGVVLRQHLVGPHGDGRASLEAVPQLAGVLVVGGAELQVVMRLEVRCQVLHGLTEFRAAFRGRRHAAREVEPAHVHVGLVARGDLQFVEVQEGHRQVAQVTHDLLQGLGLVRLTGQLHTRRDAGIGCDGDAVHVIRRAQIEQVETQLVQPGLGQATGHLGVDGNRGVEVNVVIGSERSFQFANGLQGAFEVEHRVTARDARSGRVHRAALFDDLFPGGAPALVGEHVGRLAAVFRQRAVRAAPVAFAGHKEHEFAARLALHAALGFALLGREDFRGHRQVHDHATHRPPFALAA